MTTGIQRKVDDLGRVVIPAGIRRSLGIREGDTVEVSVDGDAVILAKPRHQCVFCGGHDDLQPFRARSVCRLCVAAVGLIDETLRREHREPAPEDAGPRPLAPWSLDPRRERASRSAGEAAEVAGAGPRPAADAAAHRWPDPLPARAQAVEPPRRHEPPASTTAW